MQTSKEKGKGGDNKHGLPLDILCKKREKERKRGCLIELEKGGRRREGRLHLNCPPSLSPLSKKGGDSFSSQLLYFGLLFLLLCRKGVVDKGEKMTKGGREMRERERERERGRWMHFLVLLLFFSFFFPFRPFRH